MSCQSKKCRQLILNAFSNPESLKYLKLHEWELLIRCARSSKLVATLGEKINLDGYAVKLPAKVNEHFQAAQQLVEYRKQQVMWELNRLHKALTGLGVEVVVLKGGAYILLELPLARGRTLSDIDILVPKKDIQRVEKRLLEQDWQTAILDEYDQHYYRTWMHEIPPLRHRDRFVEVDIHHTILPLTSRLHPDPEKLLNAAVNINSVSEYKVLAPCDMVLHSAVHLFYDAALNARDFRDLVDLHELLNWFSSQDSQFWVSLSERAEELNIQRPLFYALYFCNRLLNTKVPEQYLINSKYRPNSIIRVLMAHIVPLAILPEHPDFHEKKVSLARWLLYVRSHYLRMPLYLLIPHLFKKSKKRLKPVVN